MAVGRVSILKGAMDLLILKALSWGPMHGYGVSHWIRQVTEDTFDIQEGVLYPALHRLEEKGWIELPPSPWTPRLGAMMHLEVSDGEASIFSRVQA